MVTRMRDSDDARQVSGEWGEREAERLLSENGMKVIGRRVRFGPREELDLVAREGDTLVFVEVKTRKNETFGAPVRAVDREKRKALSRAAVHYLRRVGYPPVYLRFDVVAVVGNPETGVRAIRHHRNVFALDARYRLPY
jgi:putative endonuclease